MVRLSMRGEGIQYEGEISIDEAVDLLKRFCGREPVQAMQQFWGDLTERQKLYCRGTNNGWISNSDLRSFFGRHSYRNMRPTAIAGIRRGLNMKARKWLGEEIDEQNWIENDGQNRYRIKPKFRDALAPLL